MPDFCAHLLNCPIGGEDFTQTGGQNCRNLTRFTFDGLNIELIQKPDQLLADYSELQGKIVNTTDLIIRDLAKRCKLPRILPGCFHLPHPLR
jgi:hypothetical protein